jgi:hypothetical protein
MWNFRHYRLDVKGAPQRAALPARAARDKALNS